MSNPVSDWSELRCGTGPATRVPALLDRIADDDARRRGAARRDLAGTFRTRGGMPWSAAPPTVERLVEMWSADDTDRAARMLLTCRVAFGDCDAYAAFGFDPRHENLPWLLRSDQPLSTPERQLLDAHRDVRAILVEASQHWFGALASDDLDQRTVASLALPLLPELAHESVPALSAAIARETQPRVAAAMRLALGLLRAETLPDGVTDAGPVPLANAMAESLCYGLSDECERRIEVLMADIDPAAQRSGWPWLDGRLRQHAEQVLFHASLERGDIDRHTALVSRHPRIAWLGAGLGLLIRLDLGRRQHRRLAAEELDDAARVAIELAVADDVPGTFIDRAGVFPSADARADQLDSEHPLAACHADEPLWRILSDVSDGVQPIERWLEALATHEAPVEIVAVAAGAPFGLYRRGARDGIIEGDARWAPLNAVLRQTLEHFGLYEALAEWAAGYQIDEGVSLGLFLLEAAKEGGIAPGRDWVQHVAQELEKKRAVGARTEALKRWAANQ